jgi:hypothetical protein
MVDILQKYAILPVKDFLQDDHRNNNYKKNQIPK